jgi:hypothetical protein
LESTQVGEEGGVAEYGGADGPADVAHA